MGEKRKVDDNKSEKTFKKASDPFYVSKANFLSLLNIAEMIEQSGSLRHCWEGDNESYIQNVKREISTMKHNEHYLKTILTIMLRTEVFDHSNTDNPFSKEKFFTDQSFKDLQQRSEALQGGRQLCRGKYCFRGD